MTERQSLFNRQQEALRAALTAGRDAQKAIELFLNQHAMVHSVKTTLAVSPSIEDEIWENLSEAGARCIPAKGEHSIAWIFWHITRIEDTTMNLLIAGTPQVFSLGQWKERLKVTVQDSGNSMSSGEILQLSASIYLAELREYRIIVGRRTREIVQGLSAQDFKRNVDPVRLHKVMDEGALVEGSRPILEYWGGRTIAGLLLMPPTRHSFIHLNEAAHIKQKLQKEKQH
jgi:hypothetical protein